MKKKQQIYRPPFWAFNGHIETIAQAMLRPDAPITFQSENLELPDHDFIHLNWHRQGNAKLIIIIPGLESNAQQGYVRHLAAVLAQEGFDVLVPDHRGGNDFPNRLYRSYHSGNSEDLALIMQSDKVKAYPECYLAGFSLGANIVLKYLGEQEGEAPVAKAAAVSTPFNLALCSDHLEARSNRIYQRRFMRKLKRRLYQKHNDFPGQLTTAAIEQCDTIKSIDDLYTAPAHGFADADDYYARCSSKRFLRRITTPTLVVSAHNDPLIPLEEEVNNILSDNVAITAFITPNGGHVGYPNTALTGINWYENIIASFFKHNED